jgi:5,10-methylenetetrahydromethanopterin reductase
MIPLGVACDGRRPLAEACAQASAAEAAGAESFWVASHLFERDPVALAAAILAATRRARVALVAISPHLIHPVHIAMAAATLDESAPGRVLVCLGTGAPNDLADAGVEPQRPLRTLREAVDVVRLLLHGEPVTYKGERFRVQGRRLAGGPRTIPVYLAATRPGSLALAGEIADGILLSNASSVEFVRWSLAHVARGAKGRSLRRAAAVYAVAADREEAALDRFRRQLAVVLRAPHHATNLGLGGARLDQAAVREAVAREDWMAAAALVGDDVVRAHTAAGTPAQVCQRLDAYRAAGVDELVLGGLHAPEETARTLTAARG